MGGVHFFPLPKVDLNWNGVASPTLNTNWWHKLGAVQGRSTFGRVGPLFAEKSWHPVQFFSEKRGLGVQVHFLHDSPMNFCQSINEKPPQQRARWLSSKKSGALGMTFMSPTHYLPPSLTLSQHPSFPLSLLSLTLSYILFLPPSLPAVLGGLATHSQSYCNLAESSVPTRCQREFGIPIFWHPWVKYPSGSCTPEHYSLREFGTPPVNMEPLGKRVYFSFCLL